MAPTAKATAARKDPGTTEANQTGVTEPSQSATTDRGQPLQQLNKRTGKCGSWILKVSKADLVQYNYPWGGKEIPVSKLRVIFTTIEEGAYCTGTMKMIKKNVTELTNARDKKFTVGSLFRASSVGFVDEKIQYIHTPFKLVIDLRNTMFAVLLSVPFPRSVCRVIWSPAAHVINIKSTQPARHLFITAGFASSSTTAASQPPPQTGLSSASADTHSSRKCSVTAGG